MCTAPVWMACVTATMALAAAAVTRQVSVEEQLKIFRGEDLLALKIIAVTSRERRIRAS